MGASGPLRVVLATANPHKVSEIRAVLDAAGCAIEVLARPPDAPDVVEDGDTLEANARLKAEALCRHSGLPALADDTGLFVAALGGEPGVHTAYYAGYPSDDAANRARLLREMDAVTDRRAWFHTVILLRHTDGREVLAEGRVQGSIAREERGPATFGYDPLFMPDEGDGRTFAEMTADEKNACSHRARALRALTDALERAG